VKHPLVLYALSFFEAFERFGYYLVLAILVFFLTESWHMSTAEATSVYGTFIGLIYLAPLLGGKIADKIGLKLAVGIGMAAMGVGYYFFGYHSKTALYFSMTAIICGTGLFKPAMSALVGSLYSSNDPRKDSAYNVFYMGVNIGAFFSPAAAVHMKNNYGWIAAFQSAAWALFAGLFLYILYYKNIKIVESATTAIAEIVTPEIQKQRNRAFYLICAIAMVFWIVFHQNGSTLPLWARDHADRTFGGLLSKPMDAAYFSMLNSLFVVWLSPKVVAALTKLRKVNLEPTIPGKISIGMMLTGISFGIMCITSRSPWLFVASTFVGTLGELLLSPVGLSMASKLAPAAKAAFFVGIWYLFTAIGNKLSGSVGVYWDIWSHTKFFGVLGAACFAMGLILLMLKNWLNKAMPKIENTADDNLVPPNIVALHSGLKDRIRAILTSERTLSEKFEELSKIV
jgi:POT family proton-dependent oligopeptide transporter